MQHDDPLDPTIFNLPMDPITEQVERFTDAVAFGEYIDLAFEEALAEHGIVPPLVYDTECQSPLLVLATAMAPSKGVRQ